MPQNILFYPSPALLNTPNIFTQNNTFTRIVVGSPTGGFQGPGSINAQALYINGVPVVSSGFAIVVLTFNNQATSISSANLVASPTPAYLYQISFYLTTTQVGTAGTVTVTFSWNDGASQSYTSATVDLTATGPGAQVSGSVFVKCTAGAIQYATTVAGATGSPQYNLEIRAQPLG